MTPEELDTMDSMWGQGAPLKEISLKLGYCVSTIQHNMAMDRERFPLRYNKVSNRQMDIWVERIRLGQATVAEAARAMVVNKETVRKRLRSHDG